jgi:hypothetical protein
LTNSNANPADEVGRKPAKANVIMKLKDFGILRHGCPEAIVTNNGKQFVIYSEFTENLHIFLKTAGSHIEILVPTHRTATRLNGPIRTSERLYPRFWIRTQELR